MKFDKKTVLWSLPIVIAGVYGVSLIVKYFKEKTASTNLPPKVTNDNVAAQVNKVAQSSGSTFPLKKGMTNDSIKQLQDILGVSPISGYFGSLTAAALLEQIGKTQIDSQDDLIKTIQTILANDNNGKNSKANNVMETFKLLNNPSSGVSLGNGAHFYFLKDVTFRDFNGGTAYFNIKQGNTLNLNDYTPTGVDGDGNLIVYCNKGVNLGSWIVDPSNITIQAN
jgi:hypothetical protein